MERSFKKLKLIALLAVVSLSALALPTATLRISDGTNTMDITDQDIVGIDADQAAGTLGRVAWTGVFFGGWDISVNTGSTKPDSGSATDPIMSLTATAKRLNNDAGTLTFMFSDTGFTTGDFQGLFTSGVGNASSKGTGTTSALVDGGDILFGGLPSYATNGGQTWTNNTKEYTKTGGLVSPLSSYSLTLKSVIAFDANQQNKQFTVTTSLAAVPEPGFYGALALGLSGLFAAVARRRKSSNA